MYLRAWDIAAWMLQLQSGTASSAGFNTGEPEEPREEKENLCVGEETAQTALNVHSVVWG